MQGSSICGRGQSEEAGTVHVGIFDFTGAFREKRLSGSAFSEALTDGWRFIDALPYWMHDDSCFAEKGFKDEAVEIDHESIRSYPFEPSSRLAIADYVGPTSVISPRALLRRVVRKAEASGFEAIAGFEFETIFLDEDGSTVRDKKWTGLSAALPHNRCWSGVAPAADASILAEIHEQLVLAGIPINHHCMELGPGCVEYCLAPEPILQAADNAALFKVFTKALARRRSFTASFMAQLDDGFPGLGGHISISLRATSGEAAFFDSSDPQRLSAMGKHFLGGVLKMTPELMAMFAPTVNSYRRLRQGNWAPRAPNWGIGNYSCGVRVVTNSPAETRLEFRLPGADVNAHVVASMMLGAGLWGINNSADPGPPVDGNGRLTDPLAGQELPTSLDEASRRLATSSVARELFGSAFVDHYAAWCRAEAAAFHAHVSAFERARYLEAL